MAVGGARILVADDDSGVREALRLLLAGEGFDVSLAKSPGEATSAIETLSCDAALIDLNFTTGAVSGRDGLDLLQRARRADPGLPILVMTAWSTVSGAVEAMSSGAKDYIEKPWDDRRLVTSLRTQLSLRKALIAGSRLLETNQLLQERGRQPFLAEASSMKRVLDTIERVAESDAAVLITGEHGSGKEVVARAIHERSLRRSRPLVTMNAGGMAPGTAESELFGHVRGAFTDARADRSGCFVLADGGTLFLDEIGNMPVELQPKLLRVLQTGEVQPLGASRTVLTDVRIVSATNSDLERDVQEGRFRDDLLYRLNTIHIALPPLRERREDILPLVRLYLTRFAQKYRRRVVDLDARAQEDVLAHAWPGNVRELCHAVERAVLMATGQTISSEDLALPRGRAASAQVVETPVESKPLDAAQNTIILDAVARHAGDVRKAAAELGLSRSALYRRLQRIGG